MSNTGRNVYTPEGLRKLSLIVKSAMAGMSYRDFETVTGVSFGVIRRIAINDAKTPDRETLEKLAPHTPYTFEELQLILMEREIEPGYSYQKYRTAVELFELVVELPETEMAALATMIINHIVAKHQSQRIASAEQCLP